MKYQSQTFAGKLARVMTVSETGWGASFWLPTGDLSDTFSELPCSEMVTGRPNRVGDRYCHHFKLEGTFSSKLRMDNTTIKEQPIRINPKYGYTLYSGLYQSKNGSVAMVLPIGGSDVLFGIRDTWVNDQKDIDRHYKYTIRPLDNQRFLCIEYNLTKAVWRSSGSVDYTSGYAWVYYFYPYKYSSSSWSYKYASLSTKSVNMPTPGIDVVDSHDFSYMEPYIDKVTTTLLTREVSNALKSISGLRFSSSDYPDQEAASSVPLDKSDIDLSAWIKRANRFSAPKEQEWAELAYEAVQNANYVEINSLAYIGDFKDLFGELKALREVLGNPKSPKAWASLILSANYGTRLTIQDTVELINAIIRCARQGRKAQKRAFKTLRARTGHDLTGYGFMNGHRLMNYKIYHKELPEGASSILDSLYRWDLLPTTGNIWDLIPYSFVIDWFVNIGANLELADAKAYTQTLKVLGITYSYKDTFQLPPSVDGVMVMGGQLSVYHRMLSNSITLPSYSLELNQGYQNNIIQGGSLLIQRMK